MLKKAQLKILNCHFSDGWKKSINTFAEHIHRDKFNGQPVIFFDVMILHTSAFKTAGILESDKGTVFEDSAWEGGGDTKMKDPSSSCA